MTMSVHTNTGAMIALQNLNKTNDDMLGVQNRINTGLKISGAKDNAAIYAVAQGMRADIRALEAVQSGLDRASTIGDVALAAGESISDATEGTSGDSGVGGASGGVRMGTSPRGGCAGALPRLSMASCMSRTTWATLTT